MSSALAMILTAAMAVPGNGPGAVSAETEQQLDLGGIWRGTWLDDCGESWVAYVSEGEMVVKQQGEPIWQLRGRSFIDLDSVTDEGRGQIRATSRDGNHDFFGIYEQDGGRLSVCFREAERPTFFGGGSGQSLLTLRRVRDEEVEKLFFLRRVKPRK